MNAAQALGSLINGILMVLAPSAFMAPEYGVYRRVTFEMIYPVVDVLEALGLAYLFYFQGSKAQRPSKNASTDLL